MTETVAVEASTRIEPAESDWHSPLHRYLADPNLAIIADPTRGGRLRWFLYCTQDGAANWGATEFRVYTSDDLVTWQDGGTILSLADVPWARGPGKGGAGAWAPTILCHAGQYYLYFVADSQIGVASSHSPYGPFSARRSPLISVNDKWLGMPIDPSILRLRDGQANSLNPGTDDTSGMETTRADSANGSEGESNLTDWLVWGNGVATFCPLSKDRMELAYGMLHSRVKGWTPASFREAMWVFKRDGRFYASWSVNDTREATYHIEYATAPTLDGPWQEHGILVEGDAETGIVGTGHHAIVRMPGTDTWVIAYHCFDAADGDGTHRQIRFARLRFRKDGTIRPVNVAEPSLRAKID